MDGAATLASTTLAPGDILIVRDTRIWSWLIRIGAALHDQPNTWNHVIVAHHTDDAGTRWGIEARPGGVGWVDLAQWTSSRWSIDNANQPKTAEQRATITDLAKGMLGTPYDWAAIVHDAMAALDAPDLWRMNSWAGDNGPPAHVVCSSFAAWLYGKVGLAHPAGQGRWITPADWGTFMLRQDWAR